MIVIDDIIQGSPEWFQEKLGKPSSSNFDKIVTSKGERSKQRKEYMYRLAGERISGTSIETYSNASMERGIALEHEARGLFRLLKAVECRTVGMCYPDESKKYLCSPDSLLDNWDINFCDLKESGLEIKCPLIHTHVGYLLNNKLPTKYIAQVQGSMAVTGYDSWFFMSYYPELPPLILEVKRDEPFIKKLKKELDYFCIELDDVVKELGRLK